VIGITSPRELEDTNPQLQLAYVFAEQITQFINKRALDNDCSGAYDGTGRQGWIKYIMDWAVAHELVGHHIGRLSEYGTFGQHADGYLGFDIMDRLGMCDAVAQTPPLKEFCKDNDQNPNNSCRDRLKAIVP
jgi:hypothetical protein